MKKKNSKVITVKALCFGTYAKALLSAMPESYNEQIAITQLLLDFIIAKKSLVDRNKKPLAVTDKMASELFGFKADVRKTIKEAAASELVRGSSKEYFQTDVVPGISPELIDDLISRLTEIISYDESIPLAKSESLLAIAHSETLGEFLSVSFLYAIQRTNKHNDSAENNSNSPDNKKSIWEASKNDYHSSRSVGNRFANLNILSRLLPSGYVVQDRWEDYGKTEDGEILPLQELLNDYAQNNVSVIGEGGIGKTTFLLKLMEGTYGAKYDKKAAVPIFIELNRCPVHIGEWISTKTQKTNFITRYVAAQIGSCEYEDVPNDLLTLVEDEFRKASKNGKHENPDYLILLDGFNEVNRSPAIDKHGAFIGSTVRQLLSNEIDVLMSCPNVRVIMTSRKMDKAYFSGETKNVELTGVKKEDIRNHLRDNNYRAADINAISSSFQLMECLRIPLFLCMFTAGGASGEYRPTTRGEILNNFFNQPKGPYTERETAVRINAPSSLTMTQTWFILDFVLPHIGWTYEYTEFFAFEKNKLLESIAEFFDSEDEEVTFWNKKIIAFPDYETEAISLSDIKDSLASKGSAVLDCIVNTLGVMYRDKDFNYYFIHHHVRDYFAGMYEIQRMRMAAVFWRRYNETNNRAYIIDAFNSLSLLNFDIWSGIKRNFIGEILCEHKNAPILVDGKWMLPIITTRQQELLRTVLDIYRNAEQPPMNGIMNVVETIKDVRCILAGEDFSGLNMTECRLHGINCSVGRGEGRLFANFNGCYISDDTFQVEGHFEEMLEFAYSTHGDELFTMSAENTVKRWEVLSGRCINTIKLENGVLHESENLIQCRLVVANNDESFLTGGYEYTEETKGHFCFVQEYNWKHECLKYRSQGKFRDLNVMNYSTDDNFIIAVFSHNNLRLYKKGELSPVYATELTEVGNVIDARILNDKEIFLFYTVGTIFVEETPDDVEDVTYQIAIYNIETAQTDVLYSYAITADWDEDDAESILSPPYAFNPRNDTVVFWDNGHLKKLLLSTREVENVPYPHDEPDFMIFERGANNLLLLYFDTCVTYVLEECYEFSRHQYDDLTFQLAGTHSALYLLMFDEQLKPYEWSLLQSRPIEKYQYSNRNITDVYVKSTTKELLVTFDNDSLVILDEQGTLVESLYFGKSDAQTCMSLYSNVHDCLIFLYENDSYDYIECHYLSSGKTQYAYFDTVEKNKIRSIALPSSEDKIFCEFENKVTEIDLLTLESTPVYSATDDEVVQAVHYDAERDIVNIIVTYVPKDESNIPKRPCAYEYKQIPNGAYVRIAWYELPHLHRDYLNEFSPFYKEVYTQPRSDGDKLKLNHEYFLNYGVFLDFDDVIEEAMRVEKHIEFGPSAGQTVIVNLNPLVANYVIGDIPALVTYLVEDNEAPLFQLLYINESENATVAIHNKEIIVLKYCGDKYEEISRFKHLHPGEYGSPADGGIVQGNTVYFWKYPNLLCSFNMETETLKCYESYVPGLSVVGCDFNGATMSNTVKDMLATHGGKI